jgi:hypothetical protein
MALRFSTFIDTVADNRIILLRNPQVVKWVHGDLSFLSSRKKEHEDTWGRVILNSNRAIIQWSGQLGEAIGKEACILLYGDYQIPVPVNRFQLDIETDTHMIEIKTQTHLTGGTASEKIPAVSFKYADVPFLTGKKLKIVCIAGAEEQSKKCGLLPGPERTPQKQKYIDFFSDNDVEFIGLSELLGALPPLSLDLSSE